MLDGNAIAGMLAEIFDRDMTMARAVCAACGADRTLAETAVYVHAPGNVVRCRSCEAVLAVVVVRRERYCVDLRGVSSLAAQHAGR